MKRRFALPVLLLALSAPWAAAQVPAGGEFQVDISTGDGWFPSVAADSVGDFTVVWLGSPGGIAGQRYDASGTPSGAAFQVNSSTVYPGLWPQYGPAVAADVAGNFVVVWASPQYTGHPYIFGQRFDASGTRLGGEFQVNTSTAARNQPSVASSASGPFVVVWTSYGQDASGVGVSGQRYDAAGVPQGAEFQVNTYTTGNQGDAAVASDPAGNFVVVWADGDRAGVFAQRYDASGTPQGEEFLVGSGSAPSVASDASGNFVVVVWSAGDVLARRYDPSGTPRGPALLVAEAQHDDASGTRQPAESIVLGARGPSVASDATGDFVVTWDHGVVVVVPPQPPTGPPPTYEIGVFGRWYDAGGNPRGRDFRVATGNAFNPAVASDAVGNFVVVSDREYANPRMPPFVWPAGVFGQRYFGGLVPAALATDTTPGESADGNLVLEAGETVDVRPAWTNFTGSAQAFVGSAAFTGPPADGVSYSLLDGSGDYGSVPDNATSQCTDCYQVAVAFAGTRPAVHWDAVLTETITPAQPAAMPWKLHIGESFSDVPKTSAYYRFVETLLHRGVTAGCTASTYCPATITTREQMAVFALVAREGAGYTPPGCGFNLWTPIYADVPAYSPYCAWIEELSRRGVVTGCGGGNYCPTAEVAREQMPVFMLRTLDAAIDPPACTTPMFGDVPADSPYCRWIEELARRGVVTGCGDGKYCPADAVTREQMSVFVSATFGLTLYGP